MELFSARFLGSTELFCCFYSILDGFFIGRTVPADPYRRALHQKKNNASRYVKSCEKSARALWIIAFMNYSHRWPIPSSPSPRCCCCSSSPPPHFSCFGFVLFELFFCHEQPVAAATVFVSNLLSTRCCRK